MAKRSTTIWIIVGIVAVLVLVGIVGVVALPRVFGAQGFCDEVTGLRLELTQSAVDADSDAEVLEAQRSLAAETADDLQSEADRVRFPSGAGGDADEVAASWQVVAESEGEDTAVASREFFGLDDAYQDEYCGGPPTAEDLGG
jgi:hypothetical protein